MPYHRRHTFGRIQPKRVTTIEEANELIGRLTTELNTTHQKMNEALVDIERSAGGSGTTTTVIVASGSGGSGGTATVPTIAVGSMALTGGVETTVPFGKTFGSAFELMVWCFREENRYAVGVDIPSSKITATKFAATALVDATIVFMAIEK